MGMGKFGQGDPTKTQHRISSSNTGTHHLAGDLIIEEILVFPDLPHSPPGVALVLSRVIQTMVL